MKSKRKNKSKQEIFTDIKAIQETDRKRKLIKEVIYPFLLELNNNIGFTKIFLQTAATTLDSVFTESQKTIKVEQFIPRLKEIYKPDDHKLQEEYNKYIRLYELLKDENVFTFISLISSTPRAIEQYFTKEADKHQIIDLNIDTILG